MVTSIDTPFVSSAGGTKISLALPDVLPGTFIVHVGPLGSAEDKACYAGFGLATGETITMLAGSMDLVVPALAIGGPYQFFLRRQSGAGAATFLTIALLTACPQDFPGRTLSLRRVLPRHWRLGYRNLDLIPPQAVA